MSRPRGRNWQPFATDEEIAILVRAGWSDCRIALMFDAHHTSIRYRRRKLGLPPGPNPRLRRIGIKRRLWEEARAGQGAPTA